MVLIVEDEFLLRMDAVDMIAAAGFEVVEAANADEAIGILEALGIAETDLLDGRIELARAVRDAGRRSRLSQPPAASGLRKPICPMAEGFYRNPAVRQMLRAYCET